MDEVVQYDRGGKTIIEREFSATTNGQTVEINDANLENVGNEFGSLKPKETGTKPKDIPPKPTKHQATKPFSNPGLSASGTFQTIPNDHQVTNVRGQRATEQTILNKKTRNISVHDASTKIDTEAHRKQGKMPHKLERDHTMGYWGPNKPGVDALSLKPKDKQANDEFLDRTSP